MRSIPAKLLLTTLPVLALAGIAAGWWTLRGHGGRVATRDLLSHYCVDCHNPVDLTADLAIDPKSIDAVGARPEQWEKVVRKLRAETMPPDDPRPAHEGYVQAAAFLEQELDANAAARPNAGDVPLFRRLTRTEYRNAIRDLLALDHLPSELDFELLLPADNASSGFDNIADLLFVSPVVLERYVTAAQKLARLAVGDMRMPVTVNIHKLSEQLPQDERVEGLSFGTRGGLATEMYFPLDADYTVDVETASGTREEHEIEISVDGARAAVQKIGVATPVPRRGADRVTFRVPVPAGSHLLGVTFVERSEALDENLVRSRMRSRGTLPAMAIATIRGPYSPTGPGDTPSRRRIFICRPNEAATETPCARQILTTLVWHAYRRAATDADLADLMPFYEQGRAEGGFDAGIQLALERLLVSPQFLYRIEREPTAPSGKAAATRAAAAPAIRATSGASSAAARHRPPIGIAPVSDVELASRLSFFLWSSIPDEELLLAAVDGKLRDPGMLRAQVDRMLADPRAESMVTNFAAQWLFLRDVEAKEPDIFLFPDHDVTLRRALERETELFVGSVLRGGASVLDLLTARYTFLNERLAKHYGIPNVYGSYFRRVDFDADSPRGGLLSQGSILTVTSYSTRTSPVLRGKYVLDNLLASPPPPPPPVVPALKTEDETAGGAPLTMRAAMVKHRADPMCAGCHAKMDPIGFALEHFDAVGRWRDTDVAGPIDAKSTLVDGTTVDGLQGVRDMLLRNPELFVRAFTEKLMMYALGRNVQYYDAPAVRAIVREAAKQNFAFSSVVSGIVESVPFTNRNVYAGPAPTVAAAREPGSSGGEP
ncbi:MAG TPA: DUF1592 domain-containing protein [Gammaproteobacteria bacterium]|nr:DUF1592 domain-containing protein [Gammaproteobacteria bacterium]